MSEFCGATFRVKTTGTTATEAREAMITLSQNLAIKIRNPKTYQDGDIFISEVQMICPGSHACLAREIKGMQNEETNVKVNESEQCKDRGERACEILNS